jgi:predicted acyltransferase
MFENFFSVLTTNHIAVFPYFLAAGGCLMVFLCRNSDLFKKSGLQLVTMALLLPALLFAWNRGWVSNDAGVAVLSGIAGYVFGSAKTDT